MKRSMVIAVSALFGTAALTGCSNDTTSSGSDTNTSTTTAVTTTAVTTEVGSNAAEATMLDSLDNVPDWLFVEAGQSFVENEHGYKGYKGNVYCPPDDENPDGSYPVQLDETAMVERDEKNGDLIYTFAEDRVPPGIILPFNGSWVVATFEDRTATQYRIKGEVANPDYIEDYYTDPTSVTTCW